MSGGWRGMLAAMPLRDRASDHLHRIRRALAGLRVRVLVWYLVLFALSTAVALLAIRQVLLTRLEDAVDASLSQEVEELQLLASGVDPATGRPFDDDIAGLVRTFRDRNIPGDGEVFLGMVAGRVVAASPSIVARELLGTDLHAQWAAVTEPVWGETPHPTLGDVRWMAVPIVPPGDAQGGVFVVANMIGAERAEIEGAVRVMAAVSAGVLAVATLLGWATTGSVLAPLRRTTETARRIGDDDLTARVPVQGDDEVGLLATTMNDMLDRLEAAFRHQRAFLDDLGHELRTPLTIVRGQLETLPEDPAERADAVAICLDELERMRRDVNDLITLAKAGRPDFLSLRSVDVAELVDGVQRRAEALEPDRRWVIEAIAPAVLRADGDRLTQALVNLVANAAQHTERDDEIRLGASLDGRTVRLWVADQGPGIPLDDQQRIFQRFGRGGDPSGRRTEGVGLGLAIVDAIARAHGGRVQLDSVVGLGTRFTLVIPGAEHLDLGEASVEPVPERELERA